MFYRRRQHRLEQEQADIEYEIRVLMAQPECNKTDSDKAREEALISRLVDVSSIQTNNGITNKDIKSPKDDISNPKFQINSGLGCTVTK